MINSQRNSTATALMLAVDMFFLIVSFLISLTIISYWYSFNLFRFFFGGIFIVFFSKLSITLITYNIYMKNNKVSVILFVVAIYNLFSFISLVIIGFEYVYEVCTINFLLDILFISTVRFLQNFRFGKSSKSRSIDVKQKVKGKTGGQKGEAATQKIEDSENVYKNIHLSFYTQYPLIIGKAMEKGVYNRFKKIAPNSVVLDVLSEDSVKLDLVEFKNRMNEHSFDSVVIYSKDFYRLELLDLLDVLKDIPFTVDIIDENFSLVELSTVKDILHYFPLNLKEELKIKNRNTLLLYTGTLWKELLNKLVASGVRHVTIIHSEPMPERLKDKINPNKGIKYIHIGTENKLKKELAKGYSRIICGLPIDDLYYGETEIKKTIDKNIIFMKRILDDISEDKTKEFIFLSSVLANNPVSVLGGCYRNVEVMLQALSGYLKVDFQVVRMPNIIKENNQFIKDVSKDLHSKIFVTDPRDVFVYMYDEKEAATIILSLLGKYESFIVYMGNQVYLPDLLSDINFRGIWEEKIHVTFHENRGAIELYMDGDVDYSVYKTTDNPYLLRLSGTEVDYMVASKLIRMMQDRVEHDTDEACREYLGQLM